MLFKKILFARVFLVLVGMTIKITVLTHGMLQSFGNTCYQPVEGRRNTHAIGCRFLQNIGTFSYQSARRHILAESHLPFYCYSHTFACVSWVVSFHQVNQMSIHATKLTHIYKCLGYHIQSIKICLGWWLSRKPTSNTECIKSCI